MNIYIFFTDLLYIKLQCLNNYVIKILFFFLNAFNFCNYDSRWHNKDHFFLLFKIHKVFNLVCPGTFIFINFIIIFICYLFYLQYIIHFY